MVRPPLIQTCAKFDEVLRLARARTAELAKDAPGWPLVENVAKQLEFMDSIIASGRAPTAEEKKRVDVGVIAVRNLEESDPDYASQLSELDFAFCRFEELGR